jgi:hypothetical protein
MRTVQSRIKKKNGEKNLRKERKNSFIAFLSTFRAFLDFFKLSIAKPQLDMNSVQA